jgi:predicted double-glycine peptidase
LSDWFAKGLIKFIGNAIGQSGGLDVNRMKQQGSDRFQKRMDGPPLLPDRWHFENRSIRRRRVRCALILDLSANCVRSTWAIAIVLWGALACETCNADIAGRKGDMAEMAESSSYRITSMRERRDAGVVRQRYDYSCGSAALATLLTFGLNDAVDEQYLLKALLLPMQPEQLAALTAKGLSLEDLQRLAQMRGHKAQGFKLPAQQLSRLTRPVIVRIKPGGYPHFAVFKGVHDDRVYLADPSLGNVRMPLHRFLAMWVDAGGSGVIFAVERQDGSWPENYALQMAASNNPALEKLSAMRLFDASKFLSTFPAER